MKEQNAGDDKIMQYKQKLGLLMFLIYVLAYSGFVFISVFNVTLMDIVMVTGLNLAAFYGLGLIVFAIILALIYSYLCNRMERSKPTQDTDEKKNGDKGE